MILIILYRSVSSEQTSDFLITIKKNYTNTLIRYTNAITLSDTRTSLYYTPELINLAYYMLNCLIVDDEPSAVNILKNYVEKTPFLTLVNTAGNPLEAMEMMQSTSVDLMFLDVHMPHITGMDFLKMVQGQCQVVLTTAYADFAVEAFEHDALDYLLKPIPFDRFLKAAQRALNQSMSTAASTPETLPVEPEASYMFVKTEAKGKMIKVNFKDIMYVEGLKNYVSLYTAEDRIITYTSMKDLVERLPNNFKRVHKSYVVSMDHIREVDGNQILLHGMKAYVPLGDTYRTDFFAHLQNKIMGGKK